MTLEIFLLGQVSIKGDGEPVMGFTTRKELALFVYLAYTGRAYSREELGEMLWSDRPAGQALANLRTVLTNLRRRLGAYLVIEDDRIAFQPGKGYWIDVVELRRGLAQAEAGRRDSGVSRAQGLQLARALKLYRGDFLEKFNLREARTFEEWAAVEREVSHQAMLEGARQLSRFYLERRQSLPAIESTRQWLKLDPLDERAHQQLMRLLALNDQRSAALQEYALCQQLLQAELGIEPAPETQALYTAIRNNQLEPEANLAEHRQLNFPTPLTPLIGREAELEQLRNYLDDPNTRLLTIYGLGGMGKTRLALQVAQSVAASFRDGACFVPLASVPTPEGLPLAVAKALDLHLTADKEPLAQVSHALHRKELLLVLDNLDHLLPTMAPIAEMSSQNSEILRFIVELLQACPDVVLLITSRERLNLHAEQALLVQGLPVPPPQDGSTALDYSSVQLFLERAQRAIGETETNWAETHLPEIIQVCRLMEGLPLGIELAAGMLMTRPLTELAAELQHDLTGLTRETYDLPQGHRSLRAVFDTSWKALAAGEQVALAQCSVFPGDFSPEAAQAVLENGTEHLATLTRKSLVRQLPTGRYLLHEVVRRFASEKLLALNVLQVQSTASRAHALYYLQRLVESTTALYGHTARRVADDLYLEKAHIWQAWYWAIDHLELEALSRSAEGLLRFCEVTCSFLEASQAFSTAIRGIDLAPTEDSQEKLAGLLVRHGAVLMRLGSLDHAQAILERAIEIAKQADQTAREAEARSRLLTVQWYQGDLQTISQTGPQVLELSRAAGARSAELECLLTLALTSNQLGKPVEQTLAYEKESLELCQGLGNVHRERDLLIIQSRRYLGQGDYALARECLEVALRLTREIGHPQRMATILNELAGVNMIQGDFQAALANVTEAWQLVQKIEDQATRSAILIRRGYIHFGLGDYVSALRQGQEAEALAQIAHARQFLGQALTCQGWAFAALGHWAEAEQAYQRGLAVLRETKHTSLIAEALAGLTAVALARKDNPLAQTYANEFIPLIQTQALPEVLLPFRLYLIGYQALQANADARAVPFLETAHALLLERAAKIEDERLRQMFLNSNPARREIQSEYQRVFAPVAESEIPAH